MIPKAIRHMVIVAAFTIQSTALAQLSDNKSFALPKALNYGAVNTQLPGGTVVLLVTQTWGRLPIGAHLVGTYRIENGRLSVCITEGTFPDRILTRANPGQCLAHAISAPDADIQPVANGVFFVPQAQPFYLYDIPAEWE